MAEVNGAATLFVYTILDEVSGIQTTKDGVAVQRRHAKLRPIEYKILLSRNCSLVCPVNILFLLQDIILP